MSRSLPLALLLLLPASLAHAETPAILTTDPGVTLEVAPTAVVTSFDYKLRDEAGYSTGNTGATVRVRAGYRTRFGLEAFAEVLPLAHLSNKNGPISFAAVGVRQSLRFGKIMPHVDVAIGAEIGGVGSPRPAINTSAGIDYQLGEHLSAGLFVSYMRSSDLDGSSGGNHVGGAGAALGWRF